MTFVNFFALIQLQGKYFNYFFSVFVVGLIYTFLDSDLFPSNGGVLVSTVL